MNKVLWDILEPEARRSIEVAHLMQKTKYGVYAPPSLKQLVSLRHLLIRTGSLQEVMSEELLGLSKVECNMLLKKLNGMYIAQRRNPTREDAGNEVDHAKTAVR